MGRRPARARWILVVALPDTVDQVTVLPAHDMQWHTLALGEITHVVRRLVPFYPRPRSA
ncbi:hypothetical protein HC928_07415 [bacterium]|nr:hypothetical protein [bacterium]